jgi:hypothetical protein
MSYGQALIKWGIDWVRSLWSVATNLEIQKCNSHVNCLYMKLESISCLLYMEKPFKKLFEIGYLVLLRRLP